MATSSRSVLARGLRLRRDHGRCAIGARRSDRRRCFAAGFVGARRLHRLRCPRCGGARRGSARCGTAIEGDVPGIGPIGVFDPSLTSANGQTRVWMAYSEVQASPTWPTQNDHVVRTRLARTDDLGGTFTDAAANPTSFLDVTLPLAPLNNAGTWVAEVSSLVWDEGAADGERWKLFFHHYLLINGVRHFEHGWIGMKRAATPELLGSATPFTTPATTSLAAGRSLRWAAPRSAPANAPRRSRGLHHGQRAIALRHERDARGRAVLFRVRHRRTCLPADLQRAVRYDDAGFVVLRRNAAHARRCRRTRIRQRLQRNFARAHHEWRAGPAHHAGEVDAVHGLLRRVCRVSAHDRRRALGKRELDIAGRSWNRRCFPWRVAATDSFRLFATHLAIP